MNTDRLTINQAADLLGVSIDTMRRWDKNGRLVAERDSGRGHRHYRLAAVEAVLADNCVRNSERWATAAVAGPVPDLFYCPDSSVFQSRLYRLRSDLARTIGESPLVSLIVAAAGEIGDNSFAHNLGNWPDTAGIFFGFDRRHRAVVLADRGLGVLATLRRVRPELSDDQEALKTAFTEIVSGRAPESRGNGLKYIRGLTENYPLRLHFASGQVQLDLPGRRKALKITKSQRPVRGCYAIIRF